MSELSDILPEHDFWRFCLLGGFAILFVGVVAILSTQAPYLLGIAAVLGFIAWMHRANDADKATAKTVEDESELDAVEVLRARYANEDIDESEFEHRLEMLLETESAKPREKELSFR